MIELCKLEDCTGCEACVNICPVDCIDMVVSDEGFEHPVIDHNRCTSCGLCQKACPVLTPVKIEKNKKLKVFASWILDEKIRTSSSSGGIFTAIANYVLDNNGYVYGAVFDGDWNVYHTGTDTKEGLKNIRGSKYVQSKIGLTFREIEDRLKNGQLVLFTGAPCQVAGMKNYLRGKYNDLIITVDFVCHGVPSPGLFQDYLKKIPYKKEKIEKFAFRDAKGWRVKQFIKYNGKWKNLIRDENVFFRLFWNGITMRDSCYNCLFTSVSRISDLTIADFWGLGEKIPFNHDTKKGTSLLLVNSKRGQTIFNNIKHNCFYEERTIEEATMHNKQLTSPIKRPLKRDSIFKDFNALSLIEIEEKYIYPTYSTWSVMRKKTRRIFVKLFRIKST